LKLARRARARRAAAGALRVEGAAGEHEHHRSGHLVHLLRAIGRLAVVVPPEVTVGERTRARDDLQRAHELASSRGAVRIAESAAAELRSSGARLRRTPARGVDSLTPAERRVVELAVGGLSNRDIAQSLFLSEKTVEAHLGRDYRKLGIHSRGRLAAALGGRH
jgi:DNA-binding CsgD family transcriptional regulator